MAQFKNISVDYNTLTSDEKYIFFLEDLSDNFFSKNSYSSKRPKPTTKWVCTKKDTRRPLEKQIMKVKRSRKPLPYNRQKEYKIYKLDLVVQNTVEILEELRKNVEEEEKELRENVEEEEEKKLYHEKEEKYQTLCKYDRFCY